MPIRNGDHGYGGVTKALHWLTFSLLLGQFLVGYSMSTEDEAADARADAVHDTKDGCKATEDTDAAEAEEERCEDAVDAQEDALDDRADDAVGAAWDDFWSGDLFAGGVTLPEAHVLLGLLILLMGSLRVLWRRVGGLPPWAPALSQAERSLESWLEKALLFLLFAIPISGFLLVAGEGEDDWLPLHVGAHIAFFVVVGLHIGLQLKHTVVQRDRQLARML